MEKTVTVNEATEYIVDIFQAGLVPNLVGNPGIGKSNIFKQIAENWNLMLIDFRLAQSDPSDLMGFPSPDVELGRSDYLPPMTFPLEKDPIPDGYKGWLLFFDEFNAAPLSIQNAAYKIVLDRMIGRHKLHKQVAIACAGNLETDRAVTYRLSTAMQSRLVHLKLTVDTDQWIYWGLKNKIDYRILSFIPFKPALLHRFDPKHADNTFPCPRTWHFLSKIIAKVEDLTSKLAIIIGTIGEGAAYEFVEFCKIYSRLPTKQQLLTSPETVKLENEPSLLYAISGLISSVITETNIKGLFSVINQMPAEFQVITLQNVILQNKSLLHVKEVKDWMSVTAKELL